MSDDPDLDRWPSLRREVEPLPGGLTRLRARRDQERRRAWVFRGSVAAALIAAMALVVSLRPPRTDVDARQAARDLLAGESLPHPDAIALGLADPAPAPVGDPRVAGDTAIVFVWVEATPAPAREVRYIDPVDESTLVR